MQDRVLANLGDFNILSRNMIFTLILPLLDPASEVKLMSTNPRFHGLFPPPAGQLKKTGGLSQSNEIYKLKFLQYFGEGIFFNRSSKDKPHKIALFMNEKNPRTHFIRPVDWGLLFTTEYKYRYDDFTSLAKILFTYAIEDNAEAIIQLIQKNKLNNKCWFLKDDCDHYFYELVAKSKSRQLKNLYYDMRKESHAISKLLSNRPSFMKPRDKPTLLHHAIFSEQSMDVIESIIISGEKVHQEAYHIARARALHLAALLGQADTVNLLIKYHASVNDETIGGHNKRPLCFAVIGGHVKVVSLLINKGADVNFGDTSNTFSNPSLDGYPLCIAAARGYYDIAALLLQHGAKFDLSLRTTAEALSIWSIQYDDIIQSRVKTFIGKQNLKLTYFWISPLEIAEVMGHDNIVELIKRYENVLTLNR